jgi:hypothetical protein
MKKYIGLALWFVALTIPFQYSLLSTEEVGNMTGLFSFLAFLALIFAGYALVDSSNTKTSDSHGH